MQHFLVGIVPSRRTIRIWNGFAVRTKVFIAQGGGIVNLNTPICDKAIIVDVKRWVPVIRACKDIIIIVLCIHALHNGFCRPTQDLSLRVQVFHGIRAIQTFQRRDLAHLIGEVIQDTLDVAPGRFKLTGHRLVVRILGLGSIERAVNLKCPRSRSRIGSIRAKLTLRHDLGHGVVHQIGAIHPVVLIVKEHGVGGYTHHNSFTSYLTWP